MLLRKCLIIIALSLLPAFAQAVSTGPTVSGFIFDAAAGTLRPVMGVPGGGYLGPSVADNLQNAWASPDREHALVIRDDRTIALSGLRTLNVREEEVSLLHRPTAVAWNTTGTIAVLYSSEQAAVQRIRVTDTRVTADAPTYFDPGASGVAAVAVSLSGRIAAATSDAVYGFSESNAPVVIASVAVSTLRFAGDDQLLAATPGSVARLRFESESSVDTVVDNIQPTALIVSDRSERFFVIVEQKVVIYGFDGKFFGEVPLDRVPSAMETLQTERMLLLNGIEAERLPLVVLSISTKPSVFFIPVQDPASTI